MFKGEQVRKLREERSYSLEELARKGGISVSYLSEIERGSKKPSLTTIAKLATALNVSTKELLDASDREAGLILGERIRAYREEKGLSLQELSTLADISYSYLCEIEKGVVLPSIRSLRKIASGLKISLKNLMSSSVSLGAKLASLRKEQGLKQAELARKSGLSPGLIGQIEKGKVEPSLKTVEKIASALEISPCYFIVEEDDLQELLSLLSPEVRTMLLQPEVRSVLRMLRQCNEKEFRFILDFIKLLKQTNLCEQQ